MQRMNCEEAKKIDIVDYLSSLGFQPQKIRGNDYWYLSPFRIEKVPSFKVNRKFNVWYDHGLGKGGNLVDFGVLFYHIPVNELLQKIGTNNFSFHQQIGKVSQGEKAGEKEKISIINVRSGITTLPLTKYLQTRKIPLLIADTYCEEIDFRLYDKKHTSIGFKNKEGGYELRNEYFKGSSSPKDITLLTANTSKAVLVFEGFLIFYPGKQSIIKMFYCQSCSPIFLFLTHFLFLKRQRKPWKNILRYISI